MKGIIVDSIIRGTHITQLAAQGLMTVNWPHALRNPNRAKKGRNNAQRVGKKHKVKVFEHDLANGTKCTHNIFVRDSVFYQIKYDASGNLIELEVPVIGYDRRFNRKGRNEGTAETRWYLHLDVGCSHGNQEVSIPLYHDDQSEGGVQGFNRGEHLRFYPVNTVQFDLLYGRRNDTESLHNQTKIPSKKMPAYGPRTQALYLLGRVLAHNAATRAHALKGAGLPNPFDSTT